VEEKELKRPLWAGLIWNGYDIRTQVGFKFFKSETGLPVAFFLFFETALLKGSLLLGLSLRRSKLMETGGIGVEKYHTL
jgi:hypothetical protein